MGNLEESDKGVTMKLDKASIIGYYLYEGFVSRKSQPRNKCNAAFNEELELFFYAIKTLKSSVFSTDDLELLNRIKTSWSKHGLVKYFWYSARNIENLIVFDNYKNMSIPTYLWNSPILSEIVEYLERVIEKCILIAHRKLIFSASAKLMTIFMSIHNIPRYLFPTIRAGDEWPISGYSPESFDPKVLEHSIID
jgi:hypothetical protein